MSADTIVIAGFATLPESSATKGSLNYFALEFEIEKCNSVVMDVYCNLLPFVEKDILIRACLGNRIDIGIEKAMVELDKRFFGRTKQAIMTAVEDAYGCYRKVVENEDSVGN